MSTADIRRELQAIAADAPPNPYAYPRTYVVRNGRTDGRLDLDPPADAADILKPLAGCPVWGAPGMSVQALPGDRVVVIFRDAHFARAVVVGFEPLSAGAHPRVTLDAELVNIGQSATTIQLANGNPVAMTPTAAAVNRVAVCYGDTVNVGTASGPMTLVGATASKVRA